MRKSAPARRKVGSCHPATGARIGELFTPQRIQYGGRPELLIALFIAWEAVIEARGARHCVLVPLSFPADPREPRLLQVLDGWQRSASTQQSFPSRLDRVQPPESGVAGRSDARWRPPAR
jgi:hypothetical protein